MSMAIYWAVHNNSGGMVTRIPEKSMHGAVRAARKHVREAYPDGATIVYTDAAWQTVREDTLAERRWRVLEGPDL